MTRSILSTLRAARDGFAAIGRTTWAVPVLRLMLGLVLVEALIFAFLIATLGP